MMLLNVVRAVGTIDTINVCAIQQLSFQVKQAKE
jgi:hypothetical protein